MSQPFYLGDLTASGDLEFTIDAITNLAVDGATDFLVGWRQMAHLAEMSGLADQDRRFWYRLLPEEPLPEKQFLRGLALTPSRARQLLDESPDAVDGRPVLLEPPPGSAPTPEEVLAIVHPLREAGAPEVAVAVTGASPGELLGAARELRVATGLPLHLVYEGETGSEDLESVSLALGYLLEQDWVHSLSLAPTWQRPGSGFARSLLNALELKRFGINYVSCPTCGRCRVDLEAITNEVKERTRDVTAPLTVAIMGCEVNGPGEARHADVGIASGTESGLLIEGGQAVAKYRESELVDVLVERIRNLSEAMEV